MIEDRDRELSPSEAAELPTVAPVLVELANYLSVQPAWGALDDAEKMRAPLAPRVRGAHPAPGEYGPGVTGLYVHPRHAWEWMCEQPGHLASVTARLTVDAVTFMGGRAAVTMLGRDEGARRSPHRGTRVVGWYKLSAEMVGRIMFGPHTPVLAPLPGRGYGDPAPDRPAVAARRTALWVEPDATLRLVRGFLADREPTVLAATAMGQDRPLVPRRRGRPGLGRFGLDMSTAMVSLSALTGFSASHGARLRVPTVADDDVMRMAVEQAGRVYPRTMELRDRVAAPDLRRELVQRRRWVRCSLAGMGLPMWGSDALIGELLDHRTAQLQDGSAR